MKPTYDDTIDPYGDDGEPSSPETIRYAAPNPPKLSMGVAVIFLAILTGGAIIILSATYLAHHA